MAFNYYGTDEYKRQQRIRYLAIKGRLKIEQQGDDFVYDNEELLKAVCKKGEIPLSAEEFDSEPYMYYSDTHKFPKIEYMAKKLGLTRYMNMKNFKACFKTTDIFAPEITKIANGFNIPKEELKANLIKLWARNNKKGH